MYAFLSRKVKALTTFPPKLDWDAIVNDELADVQSPPKVYYTYNPAFCYLDASLSVEYEPLSDRLRVCKQLIKSEEDFRGALRRELTWKDKSHSASSQSDYMKGVVLSCKAELSAVKDLDVTTARVGAKICSLLHARRKVPNVKGMQVDEWHFYTKQLTEDYFYIYDS
jgi:hypothetical protein